MELNFRCDNEDCQREFTRDKSVCQAYKLLDRGYVWGTECKCGNMAYSDDYKQGAESQYKIVHHEYELPKHANTIDHTLGIVSPSMEFQRAWDEVKKSSVDHPSHYAYDHEPIDVIADWKLSFNLGNVVKYVARAKKKGNYLEDLQKAQFYLEHEIKWFEANNTIFTDSGESIEKDRLLGTIEAAMQGEIEAERDSAIADLTSLANKVQRESFGRFSCEYCKHSAEGNIAADCEKCGKTFDWNGKPIRT